MANFGRAADFLVDSQLGKNRILQYPSNRWPGHFVEFSYHSGPTGGGSTYYRCKHCKESLKRNRNLGPVPSLTIRNGNIITNPDFPNTPHYCNPVPEASGRAQKLLRNIRKDVRQSGKRPAQAYTEGLANIAVAFPDLQAVDRNAVAQAVPALPRVVRSLQWNKTKGAPTIRDINNIPHGSTLTFRGFEAQPGDPHHGELFLQYQHPNLPFLIFTTEEDLGTLRDSATVVCDGNFKYQPRRPARFYQLYTIHGFVRGESFPLVYALLPDKTAGTYNTLFTFIRTEILRLFPDLGALNGGMWLFDYEGPAYTEFERVFPEATAKGCIFHYGQCLIKKRAELGLTQAYRDNDDVYRFFRRLQVNINIISKVK